MRIGVTYLPNCHAVFSADLHDFCTYGVRTVRIRSMKSLAPSSGRCQASEAGQAAVLVEAAAGGGGAPQV